MTGSVAAIVLAGGRSSRFGSDKLAARVGAGTLLDRAIEAVDDLAADIVVVAAPGASPAVRSSRARIHVAHDPEAFGGPLVGLAAGLEAVAGLAVTAGSVDRDPEGPDADRAVVVVGGDMPSIRPLVLRALVDALATAGPGRTARADAVTLAGPDAVLRPLPSALRLGPARAACRAALADGQRSLRSALARLSLVVVPEGEWRLLDPAGDSLRDVDRPDDLAAEYPPRR